MRKVPLLLVFLTLVSYSIPIRADDLTGAQVYRQMCARCHGAEGEGSKKEYPQPLIGKRSLESLVRYIAKEMPEDAPGKLKAVEAENVAAYIYDTFYSPEAQARQKLPRLELARLTVRQYRDAIADLVAGLRPPAPPWPDGDGTGLKGEYFKSKVRGFNQKGTPAIARIDPVIQIDLGLSSPDGKLLNADEFSARWAGSILAPDSGEYEFMIRTDHSGKLWVNDLKQPLIDASVKSGNDTEFKGSIYLAAGRAYPVQLEFFRSTLGVQKKDKKTPAEKATLALEWKRPRRAMELIAQRYLFPNRSVSTLVIDTPFPPDDRSAGYERGTAVSKAWVDASTESALQTAAYIAANLPELSGVAAGAKDRKQKLRDFSVLFAERAFRRPLTTEQKRLYIDHQFEAAPDEETAVKRVVLMVLKAPWFLYRELDATHVDKSGAAFDVAARISFSLWDSLPDSELRRAAARGQLTNKEEIAAQAERLLKDPRAHAKLMEFFLYWLKVEQPGDLTKDATRFPGFDNVAAADLRTSLELFLEETIWSESSDFRRLFLADHTYFNGRLAKLYGADLPADAPFQKGASKPGERSGVLTHPYLMATFSYPKDSSPIHRGVFLARNVLGVPLRPPAEAFTPLPAELHPNLTTRERVTLQTNPRACQTCHAVINPLGFLFERYDAIGRYREKEDGLPIDSSGAYLTRAGKLVRFGGVRDLAKFLADSEEVHEVFVAQLFHHLVKQPIRAYGVGKLTELRDYFVQHDCNIRMLAVEIVTQTALGAREEKAAVGP
jgi:cytochrome c553